MNKNQKCVLIGLAFVLLLQLVFFTPFLSVDNPHGNFFSRPEGDRGIPTTINVAYFILYWDVIFVFGAISFYLVANKENKKNRTS